MSDTPMDPATLFGLLQDTLFGLDAAFPCRGPWRVDHKHTCRNGIWLSNNTEAQIRRAFLDAVLRKVYYGEDGETDVTALVDAGCITFGYCRQLKIPKHLMDEAIERAGRDIETLPKWHRKNIEVTRLNPSPSELRAAMKRARKDVEKMAPWRDRTAKPKKTETQKHETQKGSSDE